MTDRINILTASDAEPRAFDPCVDRAIFALRPDFVALSLVVRHARNVPADDPRAADAIAHVPAADAPWTRGHIEAWRDAYRAFGAKPQRTPCSVDALLARLARDGSLPRVNAIVDLYNAISVRFGLPIGGENVAAYVGSPRLIRAAGGEAFVTTKNGEPAIEAAEAGEVIWRDDEGVTCRRWNWRQSPRTRIDEAAADLWFVLERLEPMPLDALHDAAEALAAGLRRLAPDARIDAALLRA